MRKTLWIVLTIALLMGGAWLVTIGLFITDKLIALGLITMMLAWATWEKAEIEKDE